MMVTFNPCFMFNIPISYSGYVRCFDPETMKIVIPINLTFCPLKRSDLKYIGIPTIKGHVGYHKDHRGVMVETLVNLILLEDDSKATEFRLRKHFKKKYGLTNADWFFK